MKCPDCGKKMEFNYIACMWTCECGFNRESVMGLERIENTLREKGVV